MAYLRSYKRINAFIQNESFEPMASWGLRMALSGTIPILWGLATGRMDDAVWITLTAEAISWVELKGSFNWRVRTLFIGALLALFWGVLGTITGVNLWLSIICMFIAGFVATLLKNMGDRASGLAICVYLLFIICNAFPDIDIADVRHRILLIAVGSAWPIVVGLSASLLMPVQQPFRRHIALIWRSVATLVDTITRSAVDLKAKDEIYQNEKEIRTAIDSSFEFYGRMVHNANQKDHTQYQLLQVRKNAALVAVNVIAIGDEMQHIVVRDLDEALRVKAATMFSALKEAVGRMSVYVLTLKVEEKLLAVSHINRVKKLEALIRQYPLECGEKQAAAINRILQLTGRTMKLMESAIQRLDQMGQDVPVFRSYSLIKTLLVLRPKKMLSNLKSLFNFNTLAIRYALRSAIGASIALFIAKWFHINHGYWLPFSLMIVIQPYFGATLKKAIDRIAGTVLGGVAGGLLMMVPTDLHVKEVILFFTFILMVYYVRKNYAMAVFAVTLNLVLLFNLDKSFDNWLLVVRALSTIGGSLLAVATGVLLLPAWDKKWLPAHLGVAIKGNYDYFLATFFPGHSIINWTKNKRQAESKNSDVFDSFNRYMEEPGKEKTTAYYDIITCNVRITRDINTIHIEQHEKKVTDTIPHPAQQMRINECLELFNTLIPLAGALNPSIKAGLKIPDETMRSPYALNDIQMISLEKIRIELKAMLEDMGELKGI